MAVPWDGMEVNKGRMNAEEGETTNGVTYVGFVSMSLLVPLWGTRIRVKIFSSSPSASFVFASSLLIRIYRERRCRIGELFLQVTRRSANFSRAHLHRIYRGGLNVKLWKWFIFRTRFRGILSFDRIIHFLWCSSEIYTLIRVIKNLVERWPSTARLFDEMHTMHIRWYCIWYLSPLNWTASFLPLSLSRPTWTQWDVEKE